MATRSAVEKGRDGCRVPLPWEPTGPSFGFGSGPAQPPQPAWFAGVRRERAGRRSGLDPVLYRRALALRRTLQTDEEFTWVESADADVLHFRRGDWHCVANFGSRARRPARRRRADLQLAPDWRPLPSDTSAGLPTAVGPTRHLTRWTGWRV